MQFCLIIINGSKHVKPWKFWILKILAAGGQKYFWPLEGHKYFLIFEKIDSIICIFIHSRSFYAKNNIDWICFALGHQNINHGQPGWWWYCSQNALQESRMQKSWNQIPLWDTCATKTQKNAKASTLRKKSMIREHVENYDPAVAKEAYNPVARKRKGIADFCTKNSTNFLPNTRHRINHCALGYWQQQQFFPHKIS